jgi:hypothetical protein
MSSTTQSKQSPSLPPRTEFHASTLPHHDSLHNNTIDHIYADAYGFLRDTDSDENPTPDVYTTNNDNIVPVEEPYQGAEFSTVMDPYPERLTHEITTNNKYHAGNVTLRSSRVTERVQSNAARIPTCLDV